MEKKFYTEKVLWNKLNDYFKENVRLSIKTNDMLIDNKIENNLFIITKKDLFYKIDIKNEKILLFIINNDESIIESMIIKELCNIRINDICFPLFSGYFLMRNNDYSIYLWNISNREVKKYTSPEIIIDMCCGVEHFLILTQCGNVYERLFPKNFNYLVEEKFELKYFRRQKSDNEKIVMISCGLRHSLALTEIGYVFRWKSSAKRQAFDYEKSNIPVMIELYDTRIKKISCGPVNDLMLTYEGDIYSFPQNRQVKIENKLELPMKLVNEHKFEDISSYFDDVSSLTLLLTTNGSYHVWGKCGLDEVQKIEFTELYTFEGVLNYYFENGTISFCKSIGKLTEFKDSYFQNGYYIKTFEELKELGFGSFGTVFKAIHREARKPEQIDEMNKFLLYGNCAIKKELCHNEEICAIKKIKLNPEEKTEIIKEYLSFQKIRKIKQENLVSHYEAWFENNINSTELTLYIKMELCDKTLEDIINRINKKTIFKINQTLTISGFYICSQIFKQILEGVNYLHKQNPPLIHRDLKPLNILLKRYEERKVLIKIADFGYMVMHEFSQQSHSIDKGPIKYMAPEVRNSSKYDTKADIYSLGVVLQELFDLQTER
jgi:hypothetical protein